MPQRIEQQFGRGVTERFLKALDTIVSDRSNGKVTQGEVSEVLGIHSANINRLRNNEDRQVTIEMCCRLSHYYKISAFWLLMGQGEMFTDDKTMAASRSLKNKLNELEKLTSDVHKIIKTIRT